MFLGNNTTAKKLDKTTFLLLFTEQNHVEDLENVTVATNVIYSSHTLAFSFFIFSMS